jgi:gluconolactonase
LRPNGLCFSPDERKIYLADNGVMPRVIRSYDLVDDGTKLATPRVAVTIDGGNIADGFRCDADGNLWVGSGPGEQHDGVMVYNSDGKPIGKISLPERCANLCFGGARRNRLFMAASHSLYSLYTNAQGWR